MALYVYGIMRSLDAARAVSSAEGNGKVRVEAVEHEEISALVTPTPGPELRLRRDNILAHADVLQAAFEQGPVLPFRFGTVLGDDETVTRELLAPSADSLAARLAALDGKVEMQLKAVYAEEPLLRSILAGDPGLARSVQRTQTLPPEATHFERIRIGEAVASAVQSRGAADGQALLNRLAPLAAEHAVSAPHHERAVLNVAFLVDRAGLVGFDKTVEAVSQERSDIEFKLIGPLPPYSFTGSDPGTPAKARAAWA